MRDAWSSSALSMTLLVLAASGAVMLSAGAAGADESAGKSGGVILDTLSFWRMHHTLKTPVVAADGQIRPYLRQVAWLDGETPAPPAAWKEADFDDSAWLRTTGRGGCQAPYVARQCLRGSFQVTSPAQVNGLSLSLEYHGGAVVYLNGKELTRGHLRAGPIGESTLAEGYPLEAYVTASGDLLAGGGTYIGRGRKTGSPDEDSRKRMASRVRRIADFAIPSSALRPGVNVLAIELIRAPYHKVLLESEEQAGGRNRANKYDWYTCELIGVRLVADSPAGLVPNAARPAGFQVWNSDPMSSDGGLDYGDPCEPLRPISMVGARNGTFSGKVVVGSSKPIVGLQAKVGDLKGAGGNIPASAVRVRYGYRWGEEGGFTRGDGPIRSPYTQWPGLFGALTESPPAEVLPGKVQPPLVAGAVMPVWVTVRVPKDARPGVYSGELRIEAQGEKPVAVPVRVDVADWVLPDPQDYRTWVELIQIPDTLAMEYDQPLWSDKLFEMIGDSFRLVSESGSRVVYIPVIAHTNLGNAESMIRWIRKDEKRYEWDFSIMDRYLDLSQKHLGTPKVVVLQVWEIYMSSRESIGKRFGAELTERHQASGGAPLVTVLDRATGKTENVAVARLSDPSSKAVWQALLAEVRSRLRQRGLDKALMLGMFTDAVPPKEDIQFFNDIAPDLPWVHQGHGRHTRKLYGIAEVGYQATVWGGFRFADGLKQTNQARPPIVESLYGWKEPRLDVVFERNTGLDAYPPTRWRFFPETGITGELRGIGRIGADYWKTVKSRDGRRIAWPHDRFEEGRWGGSSINLNLCSSVLAPGPDGPLATHRLLALIEGVQECEARIVIERALTDEHLRARLGADLARRCQAALDERLHTMWKTLSNYQLGGPFFFGAGAWRWTPGIPGHRWYLSSGWQARSKELYELAGEVQRKAGK